MIRSRVALALALAAASAVPVGAQQFGGAVAVGQNRVVVGETANQTLPGIVYVYARASGAWVESARLVAGDGVGPPDGFGRALAWGDRTLLVGAPGDAEGRGAVFVYRSGSGDDWGAQGRLERTEPADGAGFGTAVVTDGELALVGAPGDLNGAGSVYVFGRQANGTWAQRAKLQADGAVGFGTTVAIEGNTALVATADRPESPAVVHAFERDPASDRWTRQGTLAAPGLGARSGYGSALALQAGTAFIGAPGVDQRAGGVFLFRRDPAGSAWGPDGRLAPLTLQQRAQFGASIAFDDRIVWVGAPGDGSGSGAFYRYERDADGTWTTATRFASSSLSGPVAFASSAAVAGDVAVAGAAGIDGRAGGAVILERAGGQWTESATVVGDHRGLPAITGDEVACTENRAAGFECSNVDVVAFLPIKDIGGARGTSVNDIWGWTDPDSGREYAIVGRTDGTSFVDITNASHPRYLGDLPKTEGSRASIWRDMKVYRDHVYVVADAANEHGMQVFDLRKLRDVGTEPETFEPTFTYDQIHSAHNIVINEDAGFAYAVGSSSGGETCGGGLHMIDLSDPGRPAFAGCFADPSTGRAGTGYSHDAQCVVYRGPDTEHRGKEICLGSNETALSIADVSDKANPIALASISYPNVAYAHQGWLTDDHRFFYQNDEGDEPQGLVEGTRTLVWDVTDLDDPVLVNEHIASTTSTDHNLYVVGDLMIQSNYGAGLRILDISIPSDPVEIAFFDTTPYGGGGSWSNYPYFESGVIIATSMGDGLFILKNNGRRNLIP